MSTSSVLDARIYPKENQESEAQSFLEIYGLLQTVIKSQSLLIHLNDVKNSLIPTHSTSDQSNENIMERRIITQLYQEAKASKLLHYHLVVKDRSYVIIKLDTLEPNARTSHTNPLTNQTRPIMSPLQGAHMETQVAITTLTTMIQTGPIQQCLPAFLNSPKSKANKI
jgi:hypothetical protein